MATRAKLIIDVERGLLDRIDDYRFTHRKPSRAETVRELLDYALTLPPYFKDWDWEKAEAEADEAIRKGELIGPFDNIKDAAKALKETRV
ncbi:hypothetical protein KKC52_08860 [bacterium]|nr:hypothetical protein [bacterium]